MKHSHRSRDYLETLSLGKHNPRLVAIRKAIQRDELTSDGLLPIEGPKLLEEAIRSGVEVTHIFRRRSVNIPEAVAESAKVYELEPDAFKTIQSTEASQGIVALVRSPTF